jgi:hypothetical protein
MNRKNYVTISAKDLEKVQNDLDVIRDEIKKAQERMNSIIHIDNPLYRFWLKLKYRNDAWIMSYVQPLDKYTYSIAEHFGFPLVQVEPATSQSTVELTRWRWTKWQGLCVMRHLPNKVLQIMYPSPTPNGDTTILLYIFRPSQNMLGFGYSIAEHQEFDIANPQLFDQIQEWLACR